MLFDHSSPYVDIVKIDLTAATLDLTTTSKRLSSRTVLSILYTLASVLSRLENILFTMVDRLSQTKEPSWISCPFVVNLNSWFQGSLDSTPLALLCHFRHYSLTHMSCQLV
eukprot:Blabericola_migrator_1__5161@NODE_2661_length_2487_cov_25_100000_g1667_i0_p2_GENE_NODE_2661_length_2487_cov_25_100000_g1667_i0NODE_2661_length_2487_cov_25_100000_g1667_i0_p2_ORF_typecomplete_len111_score9_54TGFb_propeptide/PF00688_18/0_076_NODE_2661_length_2487_cov_25_100000_g1667_i019902322